jgi:TfoX/Sxy family transcriptional regulator of competence genes
VANAGIAAMTEQLRAAAAVAAPEATPRTRAMFGGAGAYAGEQMFASLSAHGLALKLPDDAQDELLGIAGARRLQYDFGKPPSKTYVLVPEAMRDDPAALAPWVRRAIDFAAALAAKKAGRRPA